MAATVMTEYFIGYGHCAKLSSRRSATRSCRHNIHSSFCIAAARGLSSRSLFRPHSDSEIGLSIRNKFKHIAKYTKFFCVKFLFQYFTRVARKGHTPNLFKHYCRSMRSARAAVQHISLTDSRSVRQPDVPQRPQCNTAREVLSGAYPPLFPHLKPVRQGFDMKPYRQTTPTHHGRRHASQPRPQDAYMGPALTCHTPPPQAG